MTIPHNTGLYVPTGRGYVYMAEWDGQNQPTYPTSLEIGALELGDFVDIGNSPTFEIEPVTDKRPHVSSRQGMNYKDFNPITTLEYTLNFTLDEIAASNLNMYLLGTYDAASATIAGLQGADKEYALIFVSNNPLGPNGIGYFRKMTLAPNGPLALIGDEYLTMSYLAEGLADTANHTSSPFFDYKYLTTTTTSTTTTTTV